MDYPRNGIDGRLTDEQLQENIDWLRNVKSRVVVLQECIAALQPAVYEHADLSEELASLTQNVGKTEKFAREYDTGKELLARRLENKQ